MKRLLLILAVSACTAAKTPPDDGRVEVVRISGDTLYDNRGLYCVQSETPELKNLFVKVGNRVEGCDWKLKNDSL